MIRETVPDIGHLLTSDCGPPYRDDEAVPDYVRTSHSRQAPYLPS